MMNSDLTPKEKVDKFKKDEKNAIEFAEKYCNNLRKKYKRQKRWLLDLSK